MENKNTMQEGSICSCFICGHNDHECNDKGLVITGLSDGFVGNTAEIIHHYKLLHNYCDADVFDVLSKRDILITMQSVSCSICGMPSIQKAHML